MASRLMLLALGLCALTQVDARPALEKRLAEPVIGLSYQPPSLQIYYAPFPDGSIRYFQEIQLPGFRFPYPVPFQGSGGVLPSGVKGPLLVDQPQQTSQGDLFGVLAKPVSAVGDVVGKTVDVVSSVVDVPLNLVKDVVGVVGLGNTGVGKVATGVVDVASQVVKAPLQLVSNVAQAPFKAVSNVFKAIGK